VHPLLGLLVAYLAGSIPFAFLAGKAKGVDLREHGSGNLGATNAMRVLGPRIGVLVYVADTLKGMLPVLLLPRYVDSARPDLWAIAFGVAAIVGHVRPIFLLWQGGGKGVATTGGVFFGLAFVPTLVAFLSFLAALAITRRVSVGSLTAAVVLPAALIVTRGIKDPLTIICLVIAASVIWLHRTNIARLRAGTEPKIGSRVKQETAA
jgi:acyl phosphate:glycerol-3-phosphate acyltransferase